MRKIFFWSVSFLLFSLASMGQKRQTENLVIMALDGMRWQEVFGGVDSVLMKDPAFTKNRSKMKKEFWDNNKVERRKKLFPFLWNTIGEQGQLYGNRNIGNHVNVANPYKFTYPGFSETFIGYPDTTINSNELVPNPNTNVLEFINRQPGFTGKVAAFTTSDLFPFLLNEKRSGLYVNSDVDTIKFNTPTFQLLNDMQFLAPKPTDERPDIITYLAGREYLKVYQPRVLYIEFGETDGFAHAGSYDRYIESAHAEDAMIADIWHLLQSMPQYKDKTALVISCDHGRGDKIKSQWQDHGVKVEDSGQVWISAMGPDIRPIGEVKKHEQHYLAQLASTFAAILGFEYKTDHPVLPPIRTIGNP